MDEPASTADRREGDWLPARLMRGSPATTVAYITIAALGIRVVLAVLNYCMARDGPSYIAMAKLFAANEPLRALQSIFCPLYPWLLSEAHRVVPNWELSGELVSVLMGTATVPLLYALVLELYHREDLAIGAAVLGAIHPQLATYSADVLTEATYLCLLTAAMWLVMRSMARHQVLPALYAGLLGGLAFLCRAEAIGFLAVGGAFLSLGALLWRREHFVWGFGAAAVFTVGFLVFASPYLVYLRWATGHWSIGREFNTAWMWGTGNSWMTNYNTWQVGSASGDFRHVAAQFASSFRKFDDAIEPLFAVALVAGLWIRGRAIFSNPGEVLLLTFVSFFFVGLSFFNNDPRIMVHLIPFTFCWVMIGIEAGARATSNIASRYRRPLPRGAFATLVVLVMLPQTLWPISYDRRGVRYAGYEIARLQPQCVSGRDWRFATYAKAGWIAVPSKPGIDLCRWLDDHRQAQFVLLAADDEQDIANPPGTSCLKLVKRYPRRHRGDHYDLFAVPAPTGSADGRLLNVHASACPAPGGLGAPVL